MRPVMVSASTALPKIALVRDVRILARIGPCGEGHFRLKFLYTGIQDTVCRLFRHHMPLCVVVAVIVYVAGCWLCFHDSPT
jgi:hypothetical protein